MSSIMRCRSGLMALSVMRDAPVLMEVANPSSQDRTPRRAIPLAASPAAGPYRASGLVLWHQTDLPPSVPHVRCQGMNGPIPDSAQGLSLTQGGNQPSLA